MLVEIVQPAINMIPDTDEAFISVVAKRSQVSSLAPSGELPRLVDAAQEETGEGPCMDAAYEHKTFRVPDMATESRWPKFSEAAEVAVHLAFSLRLALGLWLEGGPRWPRSGRRLAHSDGTTHMNWETLEPDDVLTALGPIDPELLVMVFSDEHGAAIGSLVHFTLHPAILVGHDWLVSADYVADTSVTIGAALGGAPVLFLNGALGNINHIDYRDTGRAIGFDESARVGAALGSAAVDALARENTELDLDDVESHTMTVTLDQRTVDGPQLERARDVLAANAGHPVEALDGIPAEAYALWTIQAGRWLTPLLEVDVTFVRIDRVVLVYVPFEVFVEFGLELRHAFPDSVVRVVSLGGGYYGYLPTAKAFAEGGYEPTLGTSTIECGQGEYLFHQITTELRAMLHPGRDQ